MKNNHKKRKWIKPRHKASYFILRLIFRPFLSIKYKFRTKNLEKITPKNCLIVANHQTALDPFMLSLSFRRPVYFMASSDVFTWGLLSKIIKFLVEPISKSKSKVDINAIKSTLQFLKEKGTVCIFPEGNRTLSGKVWEIGNSMAKLAKKAKVPLVIYRISGGYGAEPRWGNKVRKGRVTGEIVNILSADMLEKMSVEEVNAEIIKGIDCDDTMLGVRFKDKKRAEFIERAIYCCPNCGAFNTIYSEKEKFICKNCDLKAEYTETLKINLINGKTFGDTVYHWFTKQKDKLATLIQSAKDNEILFCDEVEVRKIEGNNRKKLGQMHLEGSKNQITLSANGKTNNYFFKSIMGATILGRRKINFYLNDNEILQLKGNKRFNSVKYLHLYEIYKSMEK